MSLTFDTLKTVNAERCERWHGKGWLKDNDLWTLADWSNAMCGEAGEAANIVKKIRRLESGYTTVQHDGETVGGEFHGRLLDKLTDELADVILYADLLASKAGINLGDAVIKKFNRKSEEQGFPERLG